jgi:hypothetical protein
MPQLAATKIIAADISVGADVNRVVIKGAILP